MVILLIVQDTSEKQNRWFMCPKFSLASDNRNRSGNGGRACRPSSPFMLPLALLFLSACVQFGCQTASTAKVEDVSERSQAARDYFPLAVGNSWTYEISPAPQGQEKDTVTIVSRDEEGFFADDHGGRLQHRSNGIFDGDRFLLEDPLAVEHAWIAVPTPSSVERYVIEEVDRAVSVPAGNFSDCVVVRGEQPGRSADGQEMKVILRWVYAPGVGLVELRQHIQLKDEEPRLLQERRLVTFQLEGAESGVPR